MLVEFRGLRRYGSPRLLCIGIRRPQYATLVMAPVDVIAVAGDDAVRAVQQATKTIPIVAIVGDMLGPD